MDPYVIVSLNEFEDPGLGSHVETIEKKTSPLERRWLPKQESRWPVLGNSVEEALSHFWLSRYIVFMYRHIIYLGSLMKLCI